MNFRSFFAFCESVLDDRENVFLRPKIPQAPPVGFSQDLMNLTSDQAGRKAAERLMAKGMDATQAGGHGNKVADYVFNYSMYPYNVYRRVLTILSDSGLFPDQDVLLRKANQARDRALAFQQK